jgi:hypothetical protein
LISGEIGAGRVPGLPDRSLHEWLTMTIPDDVAGRTSAVLRQLHTQAEYARVLLAIPDSAEDLPLIAAMLRVNLRLTLSLQEALRDIAEELAAPRAAPLTTQLGQAGTAAGSA